MYCVPWQQGTPERCCCPLFRTLSLLQDSACGRGELCLRPRFGLGGSCRRRPCWRLQPVCGKEPTGWEKSSRFPGAGRRNTPDCAVGRERLLEGARLWAPAPASPPPALRSVGDTSPARGGRLVCHCGADSFEASLAIDAATWHHWGGWSGANPARTGAAGTRLPLHTGAASRWPGNAEIPLWGHPNQRPPAPHTAVGQQRDPLCSGSGLIACRPLGMDSFQGGRQEGRSHDPLYRDPKACSCFTGFTLTLFCRESAGGAGQGQLAPEPLGGQQGLASPLVRS